MSSMPVSPNLICSWWLLSFTIQIGFDVNQNLKIHFGTIRASSFFFFNKKVLHFMIIVYVGPCGSALW